MAKLIVAFLNFAKAPKNVMTSVYLPSSSLAPQPFVSPDLLDDFTQAFFHHAVTSKVVTSFNTESSHLNLGLPLFLLHPGWENFIFLQGALSSILAICPNHFNLFILIIFIMLGSLCKLYSSSLDFILHTPLTQTGP